VNVISLDAFLAAVLDAEQLVLACLEVRWFTLNSAITEEAE